MSADIFELLDAGLGVTLQDKGRTGWRCFGVPASGAMDDHAAEWANRLLDNPPEAPVLELLLQGGRLRALQDVWVAITGAHAGCQLPMWRALHLAPNDEIHFPRNHSGVWTYLAVEDGFEGRRLLGSVSVYARGGIGRTFCSGDILRRAPGRPFELPSGVAGRIAMWSETRHYEDPPALRVWPGPQWELFDSRAIGLFFEQDWRVTSQSDRVGYRLEAEPLPVRQQRIISEPIRAGSIQVPESGQPIVTMRDGPTVGGYPKLGMIDPADLAWLAQCRSGQTVRFQRMNAQ